MVGLHSGKAGNNFSLFSTMQHPVFEPFCAQPSVLQASGYQASPPSCIDGRKDGRTYHFEKPKKHGFWEYLKKYSIFFSGCFVSP